MLALFGTGPGFRQATVSSWGSACSARRRGLAVGPDGVGSIADTGNNRIRRVEPSGILSTIAGTGDDGFAEAATATARDAQLSSPKFVAVGPDGSIFVADNGNDRIRRIGTDGVISTIAGGGATCCNQIDGINALDAELASIGGLAVDPRGIVYVANGDTVLRIGLDGLVTRIAGDFDTCDFGRRRRAGAPGEALHADRPRLGYRRHSLRRRPLQATASVRSGPTASSPRSRAAAPDGATDEVPALQAFLQDAQNPAIAPMAPCTSSARGPNRIRRFRSLLPSFAGASFSVASEDGGALYQFDAAGRHLQTVDS